MSADTIVTGVVATLAGDGGLGWVEALAITDGVISAVGTAREVLEMHAGRRSRRIDLGDGHAAMPGITDAHLHLADAALAARQLDLTGVPSLEDGLDRIAAIHQVRLADGDDSSWILGHGWSLQAWGDEPTAAALGVAAPGRPIALWSHDHHSRLVSGAGLQLAGIYADTPDPSGGVIARDADGTPRGVLYETACPLVDPAIPRSAPDDVAAAVLDYARELAALGIVGCHDPGELVPDPAMSAGPALYLSLAAAGQLSLRVHGSIRAQQLDRAIELKLRSGVGASPRDRDDAAARRYAARARVGWLKLFADGAMGSRTAALDDPYEYRPDIAPPAGGPRGILRSDPDELAALARRAGTAGIATQIHAIGDHAVNVALAALRPVSALGLPLMARVEHAQLVRDSDLATFAASGIAASVQPVHLRSDAVGARLDLGPRTARTFPLGSLAAAGAVLAFGTDAPVEPPDPWPGIAIAVTRHDATWGEESAPFHAEQALTLARALHGACRDPLVTAGEGGDGGALTVGRRADLIVVPREALLEPVVAGGALATTRPVLTLVDGEETHRDPTFSAG